MFKFFSKFLFKLWFEFFDGYDSVFAFLDLVGAAVEGADVAETYFCQEDVAGASLIDGFGHGLFDGSVYCVVDVVVYSFCS
jgi:hypothetical protein